MHKNDYEVYFSQYILSLIDGSTTDEMRTNMLNAEGFYGKEDLLSQILTAFLQMIITFTMSIEDAVDGIRKEYDAFDMAEAFGAFEQYENIVTMCAKAMAKGGGCLEKCYDLAEGIEDQPTVVSAGVSVAILRHITFARQAVSNLDLVRRMMQLVPSDMSNTVYGANAFKYMAEIAISNKTAQGSN